MVEGQVWLAWERSRVLKSSIETTDRQEWKNLPKAYLSPSPLLPEVPHLGAVHSTSGDPSDADPDAQTRFKIGLARPDDKAFGTLKVYVLIVKGEDQGTAFPIFKQSTVIGRSKTDIVVNDQDVSRRHAAVDIRGKGQFRVRDLASTNGTFLNGNRISEDALVDNDEIRVGASVLKFVLGDRRLEEERAKLREG